MKKYLSCSFILLSVLILGDVMNTIVSEKGIEGSPAVISCSYSAGCKTFPKSFCKEINEECKTLLKTDSQNVWKLEGRLSLHDNREKNMFVVTINNLSLDDTGQYGCQVESPESCLFTRIHLSVMRERSTSAVTHKPGSVPDSTGSSTKPTPSQLLSEFVSISYYVGAVSGVLLLLSAIFYVYKCRVMKSTAGTTPTENMKDMCVYDEIQHGNPAELNTLETTDGLLNIDSYPASITIYSLLTIPKEEPDLTDILPISLESCLVGESSDPA